MKPPQGEWATQLLPGGIVGAGAHPAAAGDDLGTAALPFDLFANTISSGTGTALALAATAPAVAAASQAGVAASLRASDAVAGSSSAGAAAGGTLTLQAGDAKRLTSGNANGGTVAMVVGEPIGTGIPGYASVARSGGGATLRLAPDYDGFGSSYLWSSSYLFFSTGGSIDTDQYLRVGGSVIDTYHPTRYTEAGVAERANLGYVAGVANMLALTGVSPSGAAFDLLEMSAPTGAANHARLYAVDETAVTSLYARFENNAVRLATDAASVALTQTYATADPTLSAYTADDESGAYTGIDNAQGGSVYATVADLNALRTAYETLRAFTEDLAGFANSLVDALQARTSFVS